MNKFFCIIILSVFCFSCTNDKQTSVENPASKEVNLAEYKSFGAPISTDDFLSSEEMMKKYEQMAIGDTIEVAFASKINSVCQAKGCWMNLDLGQPDSESFVRFKDYKFFVPMDSKGSEAIVSGKAFKEETSVEELQHYAKDAGKSEKEIAAIKQPKMEYRFLADGVLLKKKS